MRLAIKSFVKDLLEAPKYGLAKLYWKTIGYLHCLPFRFYFEAQYDKIHDDLMKEEEFLLIVLDACRSDYFIEEAEFFFDEYDVENVYSSGRNTFEYSRNTWNGDYKDIDYVSGATPVNSRLSREKAEESEWFKGFVPGDHLNIEDVWLTGWDDELGAVPPKEVRKETEETLKNGKKKVVSHFFQPHTPYIGEKRVLGYTGDRVGKMRGKPPDSYIWNRFKKKEITEKELREAYRSNLRCVLEQVNKLIDNLDDDRRVVITADHGELLGESARLHAHPTLNHPLLRKVPWMEFDE